MNKLSRRKYADLIRFLRSVIRNEQIGLRVRMAAAERLDGIYSRHELAELKRLDREAKAGEQPKTVEPGETVSDTPAPKSARDEAREFLASLETKTNAG